ncbi:MAG TPA: hypothetical protein VJT69_18335 [Pyrinomonadaceae bacterium]|nr:hypothetical protein [Pyrinomonadaceae bacterium]
METIAKATNIQSLVRQSDAEVGFQRVVPGYALVFFDHLHSEYLALKSRIKDEETIKLLDSLHEKRVKKELTWSDIYTFDLALIEWSPLENLVRKAYDARSKYRSIAGQKEYDEYLASKPPDLTAILVKPEALNGEEPDTSTSPPETHEPDIPASAEIVQRILRADIRYLLNKFYLYYAMLPMREGMREQLTRRAVRMTLIILGIIILLALISLGGLKILSSDKFKQIFDVTGVFGLTVGTVACAGIIGGCVSMLQRIQSAPTEGDALFNLAALTNGWIGLSLSPLYGAIFASLLFILFAGGILKGSVFPTIETAGAKVEQTAPGAATPAATPPPQGVLKAEDFLKQTGPKDGVSFALLMIWSFIAGFAERLVPDTLNRLVAKTEAIQGT